MLRKLSEQEMVMKVSRERDEAIRWDDKNYQRSVRNRRFYWAIDNEKGMGQWPEERVAQLIAERRQIATFDVTSPAIDHMVGALAKRPFSVDFKPVNHQTTTLTSRLKDSFTANRDIMDWPENYYDILLNGSIYRADAEIFMDYSIDKANGNIGLRCRLPGAVTYDPLWKTRRSKECEKCWVDSYMTPLQMMETWDNMGGEIERAVFFKKNGGLNDTSLKAWAELQHLRGDEYGENRGVVPYDRYEDIWGSQFRVTTQYAVGNVRKKYCYCIMADGADVRVPEKLKDPADIIQWLNTNYPEQWRPDGIFEDYDDDKVQVATVICPGLSPSLLIEHKPTVEQCGRLKFHPWSWHRLNGEFKGGVDSIVDLQQQLNYLMSMKMHKITIEGTGGGQFVDPSAFPTTADYMKYVQNRNNPAAIHKLKPGYLNNHANGPAIPLIKTPGNQDIETYLSQIIDVMLPKLSRITPAAQGVSEFNGEAAYLYRMKNLQSEIQTYNILHGLTLWWQEIGESYLYLAADNWGNGVEREFYNVSEGKSFGINKRKTLGDGSEILEDDFSALRQLRHKVIVTESEDSPTRQMEHMAVAVDAMKSMPPQKQLTIMKLGTMLAKSIDNFRPEEKAELDELNELEMNTARAQMEVNMKTLQLQNMELDAKLSQAQQVMAQQGLMNAPPPGGDNGGGEPLDPMAGPAARGQESGVEPMAVSGAQNALAPEDEMEQRMAGEPSTV